jgi:hypothetical protein
MKIKTVSVNYSLTYNLGNYNSIKVEAGAEAELEKGETKEEIYDRLFEDLKTQVTQKVTEVKEHVNKKRG